MDALRILIVDDHALVRRGLRTLLASRTSWEVCGEAHDGYEAIEMAKEFKPDVILMDVNMPRLNGLDATRIIRAEVPAADVLIVSQHNTEALRAQAARAGARGYVCKSDVSRDLLPAIDETVSASALNGAAVPKFPAARKGPADISEAPFQVNWLNRQLGELLMHVPSALGITTGPEHRWAYVNQARVKMARRTSVRDFLGKTVRESYPEFASQPFFDCLDQVYRTGVPFVGHEMLATFEGEAAGHPEQAYVNCLYEPIRSDAGEVEGLLIHTVDVTAQVLARKALEEMHEREQQHRAEAEFERNRLQTLFAQAPVGIAVLKGIEHRWDAVNPAFLEIMGQSEGDVLGKTVRETMPQMVYEGYADLLDQVYRSGMPFIGNEMKATMKRPGNGQSTDAYFNFVYQPSRNLVGDVEGIMLLAIDITGPVLARNELENRVKLRTVELRRAHENLRALSGRLMQAQDDERRRVARELHDSAGQYLAAIQMNLSSISKSPERLSDAQKGSLEDSFELVSRCTAEIRTLSYLLHPPLLDEMGLTSAISWYADGFGKRSGIIVELNIPKDLPRFSTEVETALFRIVQQSLANIHRHSGSKVARIRISLTADGVRAEISDQGRGLSPEILDKFNRGGEIPGVGISGMRERIQGMGGSFDVSSSVRGTTIVATVPAVAAQAAF